MRSEHVIQQAGQVQDGPWRLGGFRTLEDEHGPAGMGDRVQYRATTPESGLPHPHRLPGHPPCLRCIELAQFLDASFPLWYINRAVGGVV